MKTFTLVRKYREEEATLGTIFDRDEEICKTLENPWLDNDNKVSCIPEGTYKVLRDNTGKFQWWRILGVKDRVAVEIHEGNRTRDTEGCIIIGGKWGFYKGELAVLNSVATLKKLKPIFAEGFLLEIRS